MLPDRVRAHLPLILIAATSTLLSLVFFLGPRGVDHFLTLEHAWKIVQGEPSAWTVQWEREYGDPPDARGLLSGEARVHRVRVFYAP